jgi:hypothetical protein
MIPMGATMHSDYRVINPRELLRQPSGIGAIKQARMSRRTNPLRGRVPRWRAEALTPWLERLDCRDPAAT